MILKIHYFCTAINLLLITSIFCIGLYSDVTGPQQFDPFVLLIYSGLIALFLKNFFALKFHLEIKGLNLYSRTRAIIFYILWSITLILTVLITVGMCMTLPDAKRILQSGQWFEPATYLGVWLFVLTSLYTIVFDIPLAKKLKKQSDPSIGLLEREDQDP